MDSRLVAALLIGLLAVVQAQLWLGRGSVGEVANLQRKLDEQKANNSVARQTNERLAEEVRDLQEGAARCGEHRQVATGAGARR